MCCGSIQNDKYLELTRTYIVHFSAGVAPSQDICKTVNREERKYRFQWRDHSSGTVVSMERTLVWARGGDAAKEAIEILSLRGDHLELLLPFSSQECLSLLHSSSDCIFSNSLLCCQCYRRYLMPPWSTKPMKGSNSLSGHFTSFLSAI